jgi:hypothetical protein
MSQYRSGGKGLFQGLKGHPAIFGEVPFDSFPSESGERDGDVGVVVNEASIEVREPEERLNVLDFSWFRPFLNCLDFIVGHSESVGRQNVTEIFHGVRMEFALVSAGV